MQLFDDLSLVIDTTRATALSMVMYLRLLNTLECLLVILFFGLKLYDIYVTLFIK